MNSRTLLLTLAAILSLAAPAWTHPVPRDAHDRTIVVRVQPAAKDQTITVRIEYRIEVDEFTVVHEDMREFRDRVDAVLFANAPLKYYAEYTRIYGPIFAGNLLLEVDGKEIALGLLERGQALKDEKGEPLGHLRCDFVFQADCPIRPQGETTIRLRETNFREQAGKIQFRFANETSLKVARQVVPDPALNDVPLIERDGSFDDKLRTLSFAVVADAAPPPQEPEPEQKATPAATMQSDDHDEFLEWFRWVREDNVGFLLMLIVFAGLGAAHALTPGHGKTLVAAYLVGERGTVWHALVLGLVTTLTHTGVVLILAAILLFMPENLSGQARQTIQAGLGLTMGILVACLGFWLLLQRLGGGHDHIHIGGGHHHHGHGHEHAGAAKPAGGLSWWGIILLGMTGGIVPCWDAIAILAAVVGSSEFWLALPALLAFSAGLAGVLVVIGVLVVKFRGFAASHLGEGPIVRALPIVSALLVSAIGVWLCYQSLPKS